MNFCTLFYSLNQQIERWAPGTVFCSVPLRFGMGSLGGNPSPGTWTAQLSTVRNCQGGDSCYSSSNNIRIICFLVFWTVVTFPVKPLFLFDKHSAILILKMALWDILSLNFSLLPC